MIVFDSDDKSLKELFFDSFSSEINHQFIYKSVVQTNKELVQLGYEPKINPRELNLFYLSNDKRERIIIDGDEFMPSSLLRGTPLKNSLNLNKIITFTP